MEPKPHRFLLGVAVLLRTAAGEEMVARDSRRVGSAEAAPGTKAVTCHC